MNEAHEANHTRKVKLDWVGVQNGCKAVDHKALNDGEVGLRWPHWGIRDATLNKVRAHTITCNQCSFKILQ